MSCRLEPAIWSFDTGQQIPCFDRCQLIIKGMFNIKEVHSTCKSRLHVCQPIIWRMAAMLSDSAAVVRTMYAPMSNTTSHENHEKIHSWCSFSFLHGYGALLGGPLGCQSSAKKKDQSKKNIEN